MYFADQTFTTMADLPTPWAEAEFEGCTFAGLDLGQAACQRARFTDCTFVDCNLSNARLDEARLNNVAFVGCKLTGIAFGRVGRLAFSVRFERCNLALASFANQSLKKTRFDACQLHEAAFLNCDLTEAVFADCNLDLAHFSECNLTRTDFTTSDNLRLEPTENTLKKTRLSLRNLPGLLTRFDLDVVAA